MARITAFASLVLIAASMAAGRPLDVPGIVEDDQQGDFHVWAFDTGSIVNNGDAGFDNWQFSGCFDRPNNNKVVNFHAC
ncbi:hypothetical protein WJX75_003353 [Coccomyxa subellipsoidea]|uniref:Uncharacterized protein n=1 Tax=Coccomyxa subellipsoidea TaxID=248742 RepID=A0ABR2YCC9_9CHLO